MKQGKFVQIKSIFFRYTNMIFKTYLPVSTCASKPILAGKNMKHNKIRHSSFVTLTFASPLES